MEKKFEFGYYSVRRDDDGGVIEFGLPFIALNDDTAKKFVHDKLKADVKDIDPCKFTLYRLGRFCPTDIRPLVLCKREPMKVCTLGDIMAALGELVKVGESVE